VNDHGVSRALVVAGWVAVVGGIGFVGTGQVDLLGLSDGTGGDRWAQWGLIGVAVLAVGGIAADVLDLGVRNSNRSARVRAARLRAERLRRARLREQNAREQWHSPPAVDGINLPDDPNLSSTFRDA
jgi:hypothetical protein